MFIIDQAGHAGWSGMLNCREIFVVEDFLHDPFDD